MPYCTVKKMFGYYDVIIAKLGMRSLSMAMCSRVAELLKCPPVHCAVINKHAGPEAGLFLHRLGFRELPGLPFACFTSFKQSDVPHSPQSPDKLLYYYALDIASLYPVLALHLQPSDTVLDLCAAPGGKAFSILQVVESEVGGAVALNDSSASRARRLGDVVRKCVTKGLQHSIRITRRKGEDWGDIERSVFDKVLVDVPCSADRHNIQKWVAKNRFWPDSEKFIKVQQSLLVSAVHAVRNEGTVVYSTCTMSTHENDAVVDGAVKQVASMGYHVEVELPLDYALERTLFGDVKETNLGRLIVPSTSLNIGPMYLTKLRVNKQGFE
jgi:16S rRNA C967 or C1407 C5-methylase (RsmB/RsmF family)